MPQVLPIGWEDPGNEWENEDNALDGVIGTFATRYDMPYKTFSNWLVFLFPGISVTKIYTYVTSDTRFTTYEVQWYNGNRWQGGGEAVFYYTSDWDFRFFVTQPVSKVRIRLKTYTGTLSNVHINACVLEAECVGPLVAICSFLYQVGTFFIDLSLDISALWMIGVFLATPFETLGELFYTGAEWCCLASGRLQILLDVIAEGLTAEALIVLLQNNFPTLYALITDPVGWFLVQLTLAFDLEPWHTQSLEFLAKWILETYFPALYTLWLDLAGGFLSLLEIRAPILYYLVVDPEGEIRYLVGQWFNLEPYQIGNWDLIFKALMEWFFPILWALYLDPEAWLVEHVDPRILGLPEMVAAFFDDPWGWLFDRLEDQLEAYALRIYELTLEIIASLLGV